MDINHKQLKSLVEQTHLAFEQYQQHPSSAEHAQAYADAVLARDQYVQKIRLSLQQKNDPV